MTEAPANDNPDIETYTANHRIGVTRKGSQF
jgi:hypothetical protein